MPPDIEQHILGYFRHQMDVQEDARFRLRLLRCSEDEVSEYMTLAKHRSKTSGWTFAQELERIIAKLAADKPVY